MSHPQSTRCNLLRCFVTIIACDFQNPDQCDRLILKNRNAIMVKKQCYKLHLLELKVTIHYGTAIVGGNQ